MKNLLKYEIKGNYKNNLLLIATISIVNIILILTAYRHNWFLPNFVTMVILNIGAFFIMMGFNISSFTGELYEDKGYLTFTLPVRGSELLGVKLASSTMWMMLLSILLFFPIIHMFDITFTSILDVGTKNDIYNLLTLKNVLFMFIEGLFSYIVFLITAYFSIILSKAVLKDKKVGKLLALIIFLALNTIYGLAQFVLIKVFPGSIEIIKGTSQKFSAGTLGLTGLNINIALIVFGIVMSIILFIIGSNMLDKKVDI